VTEPTASPSDPAAEPPARDSGFVQSLQRGLAVIRALSAPEPQTLSDVGRSTGLSRAAARRFLLTLERLGYVAQEHGRFALTPQVLELGYAYLSSLTLPEVAQPHLAALVERVHESSSVSVLDGADVVYVARVPTRRIMTVSINVGTRFPAHATSMGRVLLAGLDAQARARVLDGIAFEPITVATLTARETRAGSARPPASRSSPSSATCCCSGWWPGARPRASDCARAPRSRSAAPPPRG
jgi:IclR family pca regulon transcriptional regulator